jgi:two-component system sensor histidine kinase YesM
MEQVKEEQKQKQEAALRAALHRINPHFLFNTLGTLRWLIKYGQAERAYEGMSALTRLLEENMGKKGNFVTIAEELNIINKYLVILELRYNKHFQLIVRKDKLAAEHMIPRMLIQPLVENAIFHGIVPKGTDGTIEVDVASEGNAIRIEVADDGIGILPERMELIDSLEEEIQAGHTGIGLMHVYDSIRLYYEWGSGFALANREQGGTVARIMLYPKKNPATNES